MIQCEKFFRNPTADKSAASTLHKTPQGMPVGSAHKGVPIRARREHMPTAVVRPCRANQGKASVQDITLSQNGYGCCIPFSLSLFQHFCPCQHTICCQHMLDFHVRHCQGTLLLTCFVANLLCLQFARELCTTHGIAVPMRECPSSSLYTT